MDVNSHKVSLLIVVVMLWSISRICAAVGSPFGEVDWPGEMVQLGFVG